MCQSCSVSNSIFSTGLFLLLLGLLSRGRAGTELRLQHKAMKEMCWNKQSIRDITVPGESQFGRRLGGFSWRALQAAGDKCAVRFKGGGC